MSNSKRCPQCNTWNINSDYCEHCGHLLNHEKARKIEVENKEKAYENREKDKIDIFIDKMRYSSFLLVRVVFYIFYSIWFVFTAIVSLGVAIVAAGPG
ncbi:MAG: hypothetical protein ACKOXB_05025 [Flavobacteriales bacterium]